MAKSRHMMKTLSLVLVVVRYLKMSRHFDKLVRITFVNWYLFSAEDIEVSPNSTLFRGQNGVGKSSILDGIQTCLAGADEHLMSMNAASSNGKRSGRSVRSYVLGEVAESPGHSASEPRVESNSYIALTFQKKNDGGFYSFGVSLHAREKHSEVTKKYFALDGGEIKADDFMLESDQVITWKTFEQRLRAGKGTYLAANSAREYRDICSGLMSAPGASNQISSVAMFRAIKNGLTFKERDSMSEFCRDFILPQQNIDVVRIENDYENFTRIQKTIAEALERLKALRSINNFLKQYETNTRKMRAFQWAEQESLVISSDTNKNFCEERLEHKNGRLQDVLERLGELDTKIPELQKKRDEALLNYTSSDYASSVKQIEEDIEAQNKIKREKITSLSRARGLISELIKEYAPLYVDETLKSQLNQAIDALCFASGSTLGMFDSLWPQSKQDIEAVEEVLLQFEDIASDVAEQLLELKVERRPLDDEIRKKGEVLSKLSEGQSSLNQSTLALVKVLDAEGINSSPVCDLAEVIDTSWQKGIEHFLGNNREALVIIGPDGGEASPELIERAISIYRVAKTTDSRVRRAKLVNPEKIPTTPENQVQGYAAGLIKANHPTAERYLHAQLRNLDLVETESELRQAKRAITRDGMVAANGTIGGGNKIDFVLLGEKARKDSSIVLSEEIELLKVKLDNIDQKIHGLSLVYNHLNTVTDLKRQCVVLYDTLASYDEVCDCIYELTESLVQLKGSEDSYLENTYRALDKTLQNANEEKGNLNIQHANLVRDINEEKERISKFRAIGQEAIDKRREIEAREGHETEESIHCLEVLQETFGEENYDEIISEAQSKTKEHANRAQDNLNSGKSKAMAYAVEYNVPDRREFDGLSDTELYARCREHAERIEKTDIVRYKNDADIVRENMIKGFRSEVVAKLKDNFQKVESTFKDLNDALTGIVFNGNTYQFKYPLVEDRTLKQVHAYATSTSDIELASPDGLFATPEDHPAIELITKTLEEGRLMDLSDYRAFYNYDLESTSKATGTKRGFSELVSKGSGGEKGTPYYVALGAAFMTAFKIRISGKEAFGGAAIAIFDEAFSKIDGSNSKAALQFFEDIGLQVILAAPPESEAKIGPYVEESYNVIRSADAMYLDPKRYKDAARKILQSDDPSINPHLVDERVAEMEGY
ncbi:SbcC/MukB-like Walker B domain-containing protein [Vibrio cholerae]